MYFYSASNDSDITIGSLRYSYVTTVGIGLFMTLYSLTIVVLNIFVVVTYIRNKYLQASKNYLILSLAIGDIIIGLVPINSFTPYLIYGYWPFGRTACNVLLVFCYSVCTISTLTLLTIAVDRLLAVYFPIFHRFNYTKSKVLFITILLWITAFLIWTPGQIVHPSSDDYNCYVEFIDNWIMSLATAFLSYYGPLMFTAIAYICISYKLVGRHNTMHRSKAKKLSRKKESGNSSGDVNLDSIADNSDTDGNTEFIKNDGKNKDDKRHDALKRSDKKRATNRKNNNTGVGVKDSLTCNGEKSKVFKDFYISEHTRKKSIKSHKRSLRLLLLVIMAFAVAWLPYHALLTISLVGKTVPIPYWNFAYIFGWANSLFNPFCYAFGNRKFKAAFLSLFRKKQSVIRR